MTEEVPPGDLVALPKEVLVSFDRVVQLLCGGEENLLLLQLRTRSEQGIDRPKAVDIVQGDLSFSSHWSIVVEGRSRICRGYGRDTSMIQPDSVSRNRSSARNFARR